jgi:phosphoketolase
MDIMAEHACRRRLEDYLRAGRPRVFNGPGAIVRIIDSMFNQHANRRVLDPLSTERAEFDRGWTGAAWR